MDMGREYLLLDAQLQRTGTRSLPPSFPALIIFKPLKLGAQTPTPPPSHLINFPFSSVMQGSFEIHRGCILLMRPFLHSIALKKKNEKPQKVHSCGKMFIFPMRRADQIQGFLAQDLLDKKFQIIQQIFFEILNGFYSKK